MNFFKGMPKKGATEDTIKIIFMAFLTSFCVAEIMIFSTFANEEVINTYRTEKNLYIDHIFSDESCLAYQNNGVVMPYFVDFDSLSKYLKDNENDKGIIDLKGCLNIAEDSTPFSMKITIISDSGTAIVYYDYDTFNRLEAISKSNSRTNLEYVRSERAVTVVRDNKEYAGEAMIETIFAL